jgi:FixJ family two-component response regulator
MRLLKSVGVEARVFASPIEFLDAFEPGEPACVVTELRLPEMSGLELLARMRERAVRLPVLIVTAYGDAVGAVRALKSGAVEFFEKPVRNDLFLDRVQFWIRACSDDIAEVKSQTAIAEKIAKLSGRERQVLVGILNGMSNKEIAYALEISTKAIELYRSKLMGKMGAPSLAILIREAISYEMGSKVPRWQPHIS